MITQWCIPCVTSLFDDEFTLSTLNPLLCVHVFFTAFIVKNCFSLGDAWRKLFFVHLKFNKIDSYLLYFDDKNWESNIRTNIHEV